MESPPNVIRLFTEEADLEDAFARFDKAMLVLHDLYRDADSAIEDRRAAAVEAAEAEVCFRQTWARLTPTLRRA